MSPAELAEVATANFVEHASWAARQVAGMSVEADASLMRVDSGLSCDTFNIVCGARLEAGEIAGRAADAIGYFAEVGRPFSWWVAPGDRPPELATLLEALGLERSESELAMALDIRAGAPAACRDGRLEIERVRPLESLREFARLQAENWDPADPDVTRFYEAAASALLRPEAPQRFFVGRRDGYAVAAVEATVVRGVAGIYNVTTRRAARRQGFATEILAAALEDARAGGARTAVLQAAEQGVGLYRRMGFREFGRIVELRSGSHSQCPIRYIM